MKKFFVLTAVVTLASACTWVKVNPSAEAVVVGTEANVRGCEQLSSVNVSVKDRLGPINRSSKTVARELENLGKNEANRLGGDTIVAKTDADDGRQSFDVYRCTR